MARLTKSVVDRLPAPSTGYALHWDEQDRGFGLRITKDGKKSYVVQGRVHGKELRLTIGPHGVFTVDQAREPDGSPLLTDNPVDVLYKKWTPLKPRTSRIPDSKVGDAWSFLIRSREAAHILCSYAFLTCTVSMA